MLSAEHCRRCDFFHTAFNSLAAFEPGYLPLHGPNQFEYEASRIYRIQFYRFRRSNLFGRCLGDGMGENVKPKPQET